MHDSEQHSKQFLDARKRAAEINEMYKSDPRQKTFNLLLLGETGTGKSFLMRTARKPVHIDSFDPGGTKGLVDYIKKGEIIADTRWESEDPMNPTFYPLWKKEMAERQASGYFDALGTYVIDSSTSWAEMIMNDILKRAGIAGQQPRFTKDYGPQKMLIRNFVRTCLDIPCDFILTGHLEANKDEINGQMTLRYMTTGKGTVIIPTLFDEIWVMDPKDGPGGSTYRVLTQSTGKYSCRSRLAKDGLLNQYEKPNIKAILKKVNHPCEDKPLLV